MAVVNGLTINGLSSGKVRLGGSAFIGVDDIPELVAAIKAEYKNAKSLRIEELKTRITDLQTNLTALQTELNTLKGAQ